MPTPSLPWASAALGLLPSALPRHQAHGSHSSPQGTASAYHQFPQDSDDLRGSGYFRTWGLVQEPRKLTGKGLARPLAPSPTLTPPGRFSEMKLKGLLDRKGPWESLDEMQTMLNFRKTPAAGEELGQGLLTSSLRPQVS